MAGKNIAARPASWRVLYVDSAGRNRVSTVRSQAKVDALVGELADQGITVGVKATAAAWRARFVDDAGEEHAKHFARKRDAQTWLDAQTTATVTGTYVVPNAGKVTFKEYAESWRTSHVFRPSTAALVELALRKRVYPVIGAKALSAISKTVIQKLVASLNETYAPATVVVTYSYVSTVLKDAVENRRIARTPCVGIKLPEIVKKRVEPRTTEQVQAAAKAAGDRLRAAVLLAAGTGMRRGEVFGLTEDRVLFLERKIIVDRQLVGVREGGPVFGPPKTRASVREIPLPTSVAEALAKHIEQYPPGPYGLLFTTSHGHAWRWTTLGEVWRAKMREARGLRLPRTEALLRVPADPLRRVDQDGSGQARTQVCRGNLEHVLAPVARLRRPQSGRRRCGSAGGVRTGLRDYSGLPADSQPSRSSSGLVRARLGDESACKPDSVLP